MTTDIENIINKFKLLEQSAEDEEFAFRVKAEQEAASKNKPIVNKPVDDNPIVNKPVDDKPIVNKPVDDNPIVKKQGSKNPGTMIMQDWLNRHGHKVPINGIPDDSSVDLLYSLIKSTPWENPLHKEMTDIMGLGTAYNVKPSTAPYVLSLGSDAFNKLCAQYKYDPKSGNKIGEPPIIPPKPTPHNNNVMPVDPKVKALQQQILKKDPNALPKYGADGRMGPETQAAMKRLGITGTSGQLPGVGTPLPNGTLSSGDAEIDKRMSDNAAYFKMTPDQRKAADAEAAKKLSQSNPSMTQQLTNYLGKGNPNMNQQNESKTFTNTVDELKYYSQILKENSPWANQAFTSKTIQNVNANNIPPLDLKNPVPNKPIPGGTTDTSKPFAFPQPDAKTFNPAQTSNADDEANADYEQGMTDDDIRLAFNAGKQPGYGPTPDTTAVQANTAPFGTPMQKDVAPYNNDPYGLIPPDTKFPSNQSGNKIAPKPMPKPKPKPDPKVKAAQQTLIQLGYLPKGSDDGIMGKHTREAQKQLQAAYNSSPQPVNPMQEHVSFGEMDSLARIIQLSRR